MFCIFREQCGLVRCVFHTLILKKDTKTTQKRGSQLLVPSFAKRLKRGTRKSNSVQKPEWYLDLWTGPLPFGENPQNLGQTHTPSRLGSVALD